MRCSSGFRVSAQFEVYSLSFHPPHGPGVRGSLHTITCVGAVCVVHSLASALCLPPLAPQRPALVALLCCWGTRSHLAGGAWTGNDADTAVSARASGDQIHLLHPLLPTWGLCIIRSSLCLNTPLSPSYPSILRQCQLRSLLPQFQTGSGTETSSTFGLLPSHLGFSQSSLSRGSGDGGHYWWWFC